MRAAISTPLGPSGAISTVYPSLRNRAATAAAIDRSSSMTRIVRPVSAGLVAEVDATAPRLKSRQPLGPFGLWRNRADGVFRLVVVAAPRAAVVVVALAAAPRAAVVIVAVVAAPRAAVVIVALVAVPGTAVVFVDIVVVFNACSASNLASSQGWSSASSQACCRASSRRSTSACCPASSRRSTSACCPAPSRRSPARGRRRRRRRRGSGCRGSRPRLPSRRSM